MYEKDYILRLIQSMGVVLRAMVVGLREHRPEDVREASREALTLLLGVPPVLTDSLTPEGLVTLLSVGGRFEAKRGVLAAEVFVRRSQADEMAGLPESAAADRLRARELIEATLAAGDDDDVACARGLLAELDVAPGIGGDS